MLRKSEENLKIPLDKRFHLWYNAFEDRLVAIFHQPSGLPVPGVGIGGAFICVCGLRFPATVVLIDAR